MNTILTVEKDDFAPIDEEKRAVIFFQQLLWAEATRVGIPLSDVNVSLRTKVPDGGVDASAKKSSSISITSNIITDAYTAYQIKAGPSFQPWKEQFIKKELFGTKEPQKATLGSMIKDCLDKNGKYVLVCFGYDLTDDQRESAKSHLTSFLSNKCHYADPKVDVWSRNNLISFLKPFPSLILDLKRRHGGFQTYKSWSNDATMRLPFVSAEVHAKRIVEIQDALRQNHFHTRIIGEPGIGKTRLALEATRADDLSPLM